MKKQLLNITAFCAALLVMGAQAQSSSDPNSTSGTSGSSGSSSNSSGSSLSGGQSSSSRHYWGEPGRMGHQELRASQLMGANVTGSSGETLGTISDTIINPTSGRIDFAVLSLNSSSSSGSSTSPSGSSSGSSTLPGASSSSSSTGGTTSPSGSSSGLSSSSGGSLSSAGSKQAAVPWMLLRLSASASSTSSTTWSSTRAQQLSFVFSGDASKLQSAPNFDSNTDLSQPGWRQSIFTYFGLSSSGSATGAAETPGGSGSSGAEKSSDTSGSSTPGSSSK